MGGMNTQQQEKQRITGRIMKGIGGFYYVRTEEDTLYECKARGLFRRQRITPVAGDFVELEPDAEPGKGQIVAVLERKNSIIRPPAANIDQLVLVCSVCDPAPNTGILDRLIAVAEYKEIDVLLVVTKTDLMDCQDFACIYRSAGFPVVVCTPGDEGAVRQLREALEGRLSVFSGNSGVGKSTLLNRIDPNLQLPTAETSKKLGRGRHTTRQVELFLLENGGLVADTPGFSSIEVEQFDIIRKEQLQYCFREFTPYLEGCRFTGCSHTKEKGCAVLSALQQGKITPSRHDSYVSLYEQARQIKEWELEKE